MAGDNQINEEAALSLAKAMAAAGASLEQIADAIQNATKEMSKQQKYWKDQQELSEKQIANLERVRDLARENGLSLIHI